jgi:hypothetical protein
MPARHVWHEPFPCRDAFEADLCGAEGTVFTTIDDWSDLGLTNHVAPPAAHGLIPPSAAHNETMTQAQIPPVVARYFGEGTHPIIVQEFLPGRGWRRTTYKKRVSAAWARKLKGSGITVIALSGDGRTADFRVDEILSRKKSTIL